MLHDSVQVNYLCAKTSDTATYILTCANSYLSFDERS